MRSYTQKLVEMRSLLEGFEISDLVREKRTRVRLGRVSGFQSIKGVKYVEVLRDGGKREWFKEKELERME